MEGPSPTNLLICLGCGADNPADADWCRVCRAPLHGRRGAPRPSGKWVRPPVGLGVVWSVATIWLATALITLASALAWVGPRPDDRHQGLALLAPFTGQAPVMFVLLLVMSPAYLYIYSRARARRQPGAVLFGHVFSTVVANVGAAIAYVGAIIALGVVTLLALVVLVGALCFVTSGP